MEQKSIQGNAKNLEKILQEQKRLLLTMSHWSTLSAMGSYGLELWNGISATTAKLEVEIKTLKSL